MRISILLFFALQLLLPVYAAEDVITEEILQKSEIGKEVLQLCNEAVENGLVSFATTKDFLKAESTAATGTCFGEAMTLILSPKEWHQEDSAYLDLLQERTSVVALQLLHHLQQRLLLAECRYDPEAPMERTRKSIEKQVQKNSKKIAALFSTVANIEESAARQVHIDQIYKLGKTNDRMTSNFEHVIKPSHYAWTSSDSYLTTNKISADQHKFLQQLLEKTDAILKSRLKSSRYRQVRCEQYYYKDDIEEYFRDLIEATEDKNAIILCVYFPVEQQAATGHMMVINCHKSAIYSLYSPIFSSFTRLDEPLNGLMQELKGLKGQWSYNFIVHKTL